MEIWKHINGFDEHYAVSNLGNVKNVDTGDILAGDRNTMGYRRVILYYGERHRVFIHRLVALHFCDGYAPGLVVNHIDGDKQNNRSDNLEWVTRSANDRHAVRLGLKSPANRISVVNVDPSTGQIVEAYESIASVTRKRGLPQWRVQQYCRDNFVDDDGVMWKYA
ncbi:hypothetical protein G5B47_02270 [Paenibacillus sp. 7124]|uniref:HNH nuclease domain-containing protein n=1 Tax=Paenibacillus apii TaxID=1850370 RepID=A0A6M1PGZ1_9BACL|nr:hypothetical protein [Paenibacillus apii]